MLKGLTAAVPELAVLSASSGMEANRLIKVIHAAVCYDVIAQAAVADTTPGAALEPSGL